MVQFFIQDEGMEAEENEEDDSDVSEEGDEFEDVDTGNNAVIGLVYEYPTKYYAGNPRHTQSSIACMNLTEYLWNF